MRSPDRRRRPSPGYESLLIGPLLASVPGHAPGIRFDIRSIDQSYPADMLDSGEIDLAIGKVETGSELQKRRKLWSERYVVLTTPEKIGRLGTIDLVTFLASPHAMIVAKDGRCRLVDDALAGIGVRRQAAVMTPHLFRLPILVQQTHTIATVPASFASAWAPVFGLAISPVPLDVPPFDISLACHASSDRNAGHAWLRRTVLAALEPLRARVIQANAHDSVLMAAE